VKVTKSSSNKDAFSENGFNIVCSIVSWKKIRHWFHTGLKILLMLHFHF